jgi:hypothetical protein
MIFTTFHHLFQSFNISFIRIKWRSWLYKILIIPSDTWLYSSLLVNGFCLAVYQILIFNLFLLVFIDWLLIYQWIAIWGSILCSWYLCCLSLRRIRLSLIVVYAIWIVIVLFFKLGNLIHLILTHINVALVLQDRFLIHILIIILSCLLY